MGDDRKHIVLIIHGINDTGPWFSSVGAALEAVGLESKGIGYDTVDALRFLYFRHQKRVDYVASQIRQYPADEYRVSIIAHSFGCWIIAQILKQQPDLLIERMVLCGSVLRRQFEWNTILNRNLKRDNLINECGTRDRWPFRAAILGIGYGASGVFGFNQARVRDRFHDFGHSGFLTNQFAKDYWVEWFASGTYQRSEWDTKRPDPPRLITFLNSLIWLRLLLIPLLLYGAYWVITFLLTLPVQYTAEVHPHWA